MKNTESLNGNTNNNAVTLPFGNSAPVKATNEQSVLPSRDSALVINPSMTLIDESANLLFEQMKKPNSRVNDVCECAKNIEKLMRLKLDIWKARTYGKKENQEKNS